MCGICGFCDFRRSNGTLAWRETGHRMGEQLNHRGPDDKGLWQGEDCVLVHRRLAVMDPQRGRQPMERAVDGKTCVLVYNGELYNAPQLRQELEEEGAVFETQCDTEVLLWALIRWGEAAVERLEGIYAYAFWDGRTRRLICGRDRFGVKPFFYAWVDGTFVFASELKALFEYPGLEPKLGREGLREVLGIGPAELSGYMASAADKTGAKFTAEADGEGVVITAEGVNAHASTPYEGINALTALNALLAALPLKGHGAELVRGLNHIFPHGDFYGAAAGIAQEDEVSGKLTISLDILKMDDHSASAQADCRAALCANDQNLTDVMREKYASIGFTMADNKMYAPHYVPESSPLVQELLRTYEAYTGEKGRCIAIGGGTYVHHLEGGVSFGAAFPGVNNNMHAPDEFAVKQHLLLTIEMYAQVIADLCK